MFWFLETIPIHVDVVGLFPRKLMDDMGGNKYEILSEATSLPFQSAFYNSIDDVVFGPRGCALAL